MMKKVGLFIDTWYPMVDGVIKVVDNYARMILDILSDPEGYQRIASAARRDLYLSWDDVVRDVYEDYCIFSYICNRNNN